MQNKIMHKSLSYVLLASMGFASAGCEKLDKPQTLPGVEAIPAEFGDLANVTPDPDNRYGAVLWFEQPDKTIVAVRVNIATEQIAAKAARFSRR
ncbi:MAG: hypothetical protein ACT4O5_14350 [Gammaproteobacteria bacterium]